MEKDNQENKVKLCGNCYYFQLYHPNNPKATLGKCLGGAASFPIWKDSLRDGNNYCGLWKDKIDPSQDKPYDVLGIVVTYLKENNFDGLFNGYAHCGCLIEDVAPCGHLGESCVPGYKVKCRCGDGCDFDVADTKDEE